MLLNETLVVLGETRSTTLDFWWQIHIIPVRWR